MATIAIFVDIEEGHVLPTFWLSRFLQTRGHQVWYLGHQNLAQLVSDNGFKFISIMKGDPLANGSHAEHSRLNLIFGPLVRGELLDGILADLNSDVALVHSEYYLEGLAIHYRYHIPLVFFGPMFRRFPRTQITQKIAELLLELTSGLPEFLESVVKAGVKFKHFKDLSQLVLRTPELVLHPQAFDLPATEVEPGVHYVGAGVDPARTEQPFSLAGFDSTQPIIYCARGSQTQMNKEANRRLFQVTMDAAALRPEWQFIIAIGKAFKPEDFSDVPANVFLFPWVSQLKVLSRASVMINHGGFGSIKECIYMGVPAVVLPVKGFRDHSACAERVAYHGLGVQNDDPQISATELVRMIEQVINDSSFNARVGQMREKFKQQARLDIAADVIEKAITQPYSGVPVVQKMKARAHAAGH
jgi:zeaxanthin glucosyltransferase